MFIVIVSILLFIILWFQLTDLSKELDRMKQKYSHQQEQQQQQQQQPTHNLMKWKELLQIDIITLCVSYYIESQSKIHTM